MKTYYHVSSFFEKDREVWLRKGNKQLQCYVDYFKSLDCDCFSSFILQYNLSLQKFPEIYTNTCRRMSKWMTEALFESIRKNKYINCPSRMDGVFLCAELGQANEFNNQYREGDASIFSCELEDVKSFDMRLFTKVEEDMQNCINYSHISEEKYREWVELIEKYWTNSDYTGNEAEYLYEGDVFLKRIDKKV